MKLSRRVVGLLTGLLATCTLSLAGATPASAATWTLQYSPGHPQRICVHPDRGWPSTYFLASLRGTWSTVITTGVSDLPEGSYSDGGAVHPGEWNEHLDGATGFVHVSIAPIPVGDYPATLWADDGTEIQTEPVLIVSREDCLADVRG
ncbi:hypothetical protein SAMN06297387_101500 [Streptomyces zhaozhouensis]|uniref:Uncharacterized protein n=1 Tax=Streptomyces zhaozhouensis TaxID=1300267 RepID=A0A286DK65_9ACTN|nr:DUF5980 family protein [Streptomyces zhaozhouensis]SOD59137.1 hypothetical protein SAMN06297387_101500 [Streptomyces zhaozhouensis]